MARDPTGSRRRRPRRVRCRVRRRALASPARHETAMPRITGPRTRARLRERTVDRSWPRPRVVPRRAAALRQPPPLRSSRRSLPARRVREPMNLRIRKRAAKSPEGRHQEKRFSGRSELNHKETAKTVSHRVPGQSPRRMTLSRSEMFFPAAVQAWRITAASSLWKRPRENTAARPRQSDS
jgi:hypothetical protein